MLDVSVLYGGLETPSTPHRYGRPITEVHPPAFKPMRLAKTAAERRPIVVWGLTRTCNLRCVHCYSGSAAKHYPGELDTEQCFGVIDDLAKFGVPTLLLSGGEPMMRNDFFVIAGYARQQGLRVVASTNGTLIDESAASRFRNHEFSYVGISLDSAIPGLHDGFRGVAGAFKRTMRGFKHCVDAGQKVGLRMTLTPHTAANIDGIFDFIEEQQINRACFYHLCPSGRGRDVLTLSSAQSRRCVDRIITRSADLLARGKKVEILTVDNHCDGPYLYLKMLAENHPRTQQVLDMLLWNGGARYSSGVGMGNIDHQGNVFADQFSSHRSFGNVLERDFSSIWQDTSHPVMAGLKDRLPQLEGRCKSCKFRYACGGGLRARAEITCGDPWSSDPGCYLTDDEIAGEAIMPPSHGFTQVQVKSTGHSGMNGNGHHSHGNGHHGSGQSSGANVGRDCADAG